MKSLILAAAALAALPSFAHAQTRVPGRVLYPHAQSLVDGIVAHHPGMLDAILHVSPAPNAPNVVIAAHLTSANGEASGADDLGVVATGAPLVEVQKDGVRLGIVVQLRDAHHASIGALGLMYRYKAGDDIEARIRQSFAIRDQLAHRIASRAQLAAYNGAQG